MRCRSSETISEIRSKNAEVGAPTASEFITRQTSPNIHLFFALPQDSGVKSSSDGIHVDRGLGPAIRECSYLAGAAFAHGGGRGPHGVLRAGTRRSQGPTRSRAGGAAATRCSPRGT